ncbi:hypothetical protein GCK72_023067 [Caenorhabditis remanei]|uniref:Uncharacterized protein n=1 Tax=Caenorhabditis remanei TaxID=31234 RepID=E3MKP0_CAERE|nr:hypothetical protein GCK72_023067 [Caenorhabditis remanei]EFP04028.1 hypothetical protein CRE_27717 [Caenorhabditis remanei]KAF1746610.1 hypothetical protein GCK72_023067 [Caenorhabditis remanei]
MKAGSKVLLGLSILFFIVGLSCFGIGLYSSLPNVKFDLLFDLEDNLLVHSTIAENRTDFQKALMPLREFAREQVFKLRNKTGSSMFLLISMFSCFLATLIFIAIMKLCFVMENSKSTGITKYRKDNVQINEGNLVAELVRKEIDKYQIVAESTIETDGEADDAVLVGYKQSSRVQQVQRGGTEAGTFF